MSHAEAIVAAPSAKQRARNIGAQVSTLPMLAPSVGLLLIFSLVPLAIPAVFLGLHFFVSLIQAYVFMLLAMIYLSQAVAHEH